MAQIVVVEDDVYMREELIDVLKKAGYDAVPLLNFENAVSQIMALSPDLILLDINLPFHSGFEVCKEIKAKRLGTVLILTARDKLQDELHALGLSICDNGTGIPASDLPFVFDKGFTGDVGSYLSRSTGMGLYLVQQMASDLTIKIDIHSNTNGGTTVILTFPKVERPLGR